MSDIPAASQEYRVLARKYRPRSFEELIGQEALVRTLSNAIQSGRLAHAFVLTGVRGVGKTTTARIIARALNCVGADGTGGPTLTPCGVCDSCRAIAEDRHVDVLEMDAASRTGVDDIRELIDGVRYRPSVARYKIYIIDEVHMLSKNAFNALLKTLEEPPEHVKFIFATTEIRKIPVTVLSRCQRFDLRRVERSALCAHFQAIAAAEGAEIDPEGLALLAGAADGSVRDGLSLLDQAIAHGGGRVGVDQLRDMLGLADRSRVFDLLDAVMKGDAAAALAHLDAQYAVGADPAVVLQDMLDVLHWLTRLKVVPEAAEDPAVAQLERERGRDMAARLSMPQLTRAWQMLLKGLDEVRSAPVPIQAAEMILIRLAYAAEMPPPGELMKKLREGGFERGGPQGGAPGGGGGGAHAAAALKVVATQTAPQTGAAPATAPATTPLPRDLAEIVALLRAERAQVPLATQVKNFVHLVSLDGTRLDFRPAPGAKPDLANRLMRALSTATGRRWLVSVCDAEGAPTLKEAELQELERRKADASQDPLVQAVLARFDESDIVAVHLPGDGTDQEAEEAAAAFDDAFYLEEEEDL